MKLPALLEEIEKAIEAKDSSPNSHVILAQKVTDLADMVSWADGMIDPERRVAERLDSLMTSLRLRFTESGESSIASLHDALAELHGAIDRHDRDLSPGRDADDEYDGEPY